MKVRIFKPHTHAGTRYAPGPEGLVVDVPADAAAFLRTQGAQDAEPVDDTPTPPAVPQPRSRSRSSVR